MNAVTRLLVATLLLGAGSVIQAAEFSDQRVFTRHDQREKLDRARAAMRIREPREGVAEAVAVERPPAVPEVRLQGFIRRSDGPSAVWLNEQNTLEGDRVDGNLRVDSGRIEGQTVLIRLPDGRRIELKPGQRYDPDSGKVVDVLEE